MMKGIGYALLIKKKKKSSVVGDKTRLHFMKVDKSEETRVKREELLSYLEGNSSQKICAAVTEARFKS